MSFYQSLNTKPQTQFFYGPYSCGDTSFTIAQTFFINRLAGASALDDITVRYGDIVFKQAYTFKNVLETKTKKTLISSGGFLYEKDDWDHGGNDYLSKTQEFSTLPSQEELISRNIQPTEKGQVILATMSAASSRDLKNFVDCFEKNKKQVYDDATNPSLGTPPYYLWYDNVYLIKI
jgi:hypothetical protein